MCGRRSFSTLACVKRQNGLPDLRKKTALFAGVTAAGLTTAGALSTRANVIPFRGPGQIAPDATPGLLEIAAQVRLLSATIDLVLEEFA